MKKRELLPYALIPTLAFLVVFGLIGIAYSYSQSSGDYKIVAWDQVLADIMMPYLLIVILISIGNTIYLLTKGKDRYELSRNFFYTFAGVFLAVFTYVTWYVS